MTMPDVASTATLQTGFAQVLMPVDFSPLSWRVLTLAGRLSAVFDTPRRVLHVDTASPWRDEGAGGLRTVLAPTGARIDVEVIAASTPAEGIIRATGEEPALVVMSTHGHTGVAELAMGSTAEELLRQWRGPLLLAGPRYTVSPVPFRRIVLCVDPAMNVPTSLVDDVKAWSDRFDLPVHVLTVQDRSPDVDFELLLTKNQRLNDVVEAVSTDERPARLVRLTSARPAQDIVKYADATPGTVVAMATHASHAATRMVLGSTAFAVLRHASSPVLVRRFTTR
jgi:nucleotide-binding universal stress UspA family protein